MTFEYIWLKRVLWAVQGELVTSFEDHDLWYPDAQTNNIYITHNQSLILSYCKVRMLIVPSCLHDPSSLFTTVHKAACRTAQPLSGHSISS